MSFLASPGASRNISHVFPAAPSCSDTSARELCGEGRGCGGWPWARAGLLAADCPAAAATLVSPSAALKATIDQLTERFTAAALDRPSGKLIAVDSQQIEPHQLVSWPHQWAPWLPFLITPVGLLHSAQGTGREREREGEREGERQRRRGREKGGREVGAKLK